MTLTMNRDFSKLSSTKLFARCSFPFRLKTNHGSRGNKPQAGIDMRVIPQKEKRGELNPFSFSLFKMSAANHKEKPQMGEALVLRGDNEELMQSEDVRIS